MNILDRVRTILTAEATAILFVPVGGAFERALATSCVLALRYAYDDLFHRRRRSEVMKSSGIRKIPKMAAAIMPPNTGVPTA